VRVWVDKNVPKCALGSLGGRLGAGNRQRREWPGLVAVEDNHPAVEQRAGHGRDGPFDGPAEIVKAWQPRRVGGGGDHRLGTEHVGDPDGERVRPSSVPADQRHREAGSLVHADHGGVGSLARKQRGDKPDDRAGGEEADEPVFAFVPAAPPPPGPPR